MQRLSDYKAPRIRYTSGAVAITNDPPTTICHAVRHCHSTITCVTQKLNGPPTPQQGSPGHCPLPAIDLDAGPDCHPRLQMAEHLPAQDASQV